MLTPPVCTLQYRDSRIVAGLMSGTSLDGVDVALARLTGSGPQMQVELLDFACYPYPEALRSLLLKNSRPATSSVLEISQLNVRLAHVYAAAVEALLEQSDRSVADIDAAGCHGQTLYHVPEAEACAGEPTRSTLQIGDPSTLASLLQAPVVGDFRLADMALGGQGAPLAPYFDYVYFSHPEESRALLNLGGIGNLSVLPAGADEGAVVAFDTGPANMVIDALMQQLLDKPYDASGAVAASGKVNTGLLDALLEDAYYQRPPPKSTGREYFNEAYLHRLLDLATRSGVSQPADIIATATALTVESVARAFLDFVIPQTTLRRIIVSGGGVHNRVIMEGLCNRLQPVQVESIQTFGLNPDAKEALCFAVLAHESLNGVPASVPRATGARRPAILGKICLPAPD